MRKASSGGLAGLVLVGGLLAGCGQDVSPGAAAEVDGHTITRSRVHQLVDAQCAAMEKAGQSGSSQPASRRSIAQNWVGTLIDARTQLTYGEKQGLRPRPSQVAANYARVKPTIDALPEKYHDVLDDTLHQVLGGQDVLLQVGEKLTGKPADQANGQAVLQAGYDAWKKSLKGVKVHTDPRYSYADGAAAPADGSVSTPVSSFAKASVKQQESPSYVASLPAGQRCG